MKSTKKMLAPIQVTTAQKKWLEREAKTTGNSISVIVRGMLQERVNAEAAKS